jgi:Uma2 family endonuclease
MSIASRLMTTEEFLALPDDGIERDLIRGELRIRGQASEEPMTVRNRFHSRAMTLIARYLSEWNERQPSPGEVLCGDVGCVLERDPDTTVGIDVAYFSTATMAQQTDDSTLVVGAPILAVEIRSPSDTDQEVFDKRDAYLAAGTKILWIAQPRDRTITVYRRDADVKLFNSSDILTAEPHLPGFSVPVAKLF